MKEKEELRLITDVSQVRVGMLIAVKPCVCGKQHRVILVSSEPDADSCLYDCNRRKFRYIGYVCVPPSVVHICNGIQSRCLFIVDTGLESDATTDAAVPTRKPVLVSR